MYLLGIIDGFDVRQPVGENEYRQLENTPQEEMIELEASSYREKLEELSTDGQPTIVLNHLVVAMRHLDKVKYLADRKTPDWYIRANDSLVELVAPADVIAERRQTDKSRLRIPDIAQINEHQALCDLEWQRVTGICSNVDTKTKIVRNIDLRDASSEVEGVIYAR
jgi:adenylate kinase